MEIKQLKTLEDIQIENLSKYNNNEKYVEGKNPTIMEKPSEKAPDNRLAIPLAKAAVEDLTGYSSRVGDTSYYYKGEESKNYDDYVELNKSIYKFNESDLETSQIYEQALTQGQAYELFWISDKMNLSNGMLTPEWSLVDNTEMVIVYNGNLKPEISIAVRFYMVNGEKRADCYYPGYSEQFIKIEDEWKPNKEGDTTYPYKTVPIAVYPINRKKSPLFESEKSIIDAHDQLLSKSINEIDRFNAMVALLPSRVTPGFVSRLHELRVIDDLEKFEKWPEYLEKNMSGVDEFYNRLADRLERLFHKIIKVPDFSSETFAKAESGIALAYKIMGLEFKASQIDIYFEQGLQERQKLINDVIKASTFTYNEFPLTIERKRNLPVDIKTKVEIARLLIGVLSQRTLLRILPKDIVMDVEAEIKLLEEEAGIQLEETDEL